MRTQGRSRLQLADSRPVQRHNCPQSLPLASSGDRSRHNCSAVQERLSEARILVALPLRPSPNTMSQARQRSAPSGQLLQSLQSLSPRNLDLKVQTRALCPTGVICCFAMNSHRTQALASLHGSMHLSEMHSLSLVQSRSLANVRLPSQARGCSLAFVGDGSYRTHKLGH